MEDQGPSSRPAVDLIPANLPTPQVRTLQRVRTQLVRGASRVEWLLDSAVWGLRRRFGKLGPLILVAYRSYGTPGHALLRGRLLEAKPGRVPSADDRALRNLAFMLRRFNSSEVPAAEVRAVFQDSSVAGCTDEEGYFDLTLPTNTKAQSETTWRTVELELVGCPVPGWTAVRGQADVLIPGADARFGIISDIDDTVLQTHVTRRWKMLWVTLSGSAFTRSTFDGTSQLYQALTRGPSGADHNPIFYVSKSPWNLYDFLVDFMERAALPRGPLILRDIGLHDRPPLDFKLETISSLLRQYDSMPFVLIGDSGERDPDIYLEVAKKFPGRIRAIYIRKVSDDEQTKRSLAACSERALELGTTLLALSHTADALPDARAHGLIA
jgi:phosphatidate phosphatase APP1